MNRRFKGFPELRDAQAQASDPAVHASLSASAGTGKTQVLTARVLRLLLKGARPESILCLTFTKAAAAEMANRIGGRLAAWVRLKRSELWSDLEALGERPDDRLIERARQLFARVLDCPGGLKIQTIHAFSQSLLAAFPAEAEIAPGFQALEGRAEQELVRRTLAELMAGAEQHGDERLIRDVQRLSYRLGEAGAIDYLRLCASRSETLEKFAPPEAIEPRIRDLLDLPADSREDAVEGYIATRCGDAGFDCDLLRAVADANRRWGKATGSKNAATIDEWFGLSPVERAARLPDLLAIVQTAKGGPKVSAGQTQADPRYEEQAGRLATLVGELLGIQRRAAFAADIAAGLRAGRAFANAYAHAKRAAGVADFNDLIEWTRGLLKQPGMGEWVRYKLDQQIDHVLVDEAQDTNAAQWEIIGSLVEEYFSGSSESEQRARTLFMVGDFKQAIYGFQGTDPARFNEARAHFKARAAALDPGGDDLFSYQQRVQAFRDLSITASFRSAQPVLDVVDAVIGTVGAKAIGLGEEPPPHRAFHRDRPGSVELWQPFAIPDSEDDSDDGEERWISLRDRKYAQELARRIGGMLREAPVLASTERPLTPGDILVLVRSRGELASLIVARLFAAGVPVAGVDRLHLHEPLAVKDLLAAVKFAVQPDDDLSLACLLVSPLIGWDQDRLRALAYGREGSLWRALRERVDEDAAFGAAQAALAELLRIADFTTPSRFLETILTGPMQGRQKIYARLGMAARDALDELMNSALEFERSETASLDRFLGWFSRGTVDVQRDPGAPANEVRVMTVHGAKGLEAPVVIVADATADPARLGRVPLAVEIDVEGVGKAPLLRPKKEERGPPFEEAMAEREARDMEEHLRLLYVALTRAADRLIVSGVQPKALKSGADPRPQNCWHRTVEQAMAPIAEPGVGYLALRFGSAAGGPAARTKQKHDLEPFAVPAWATRPAPPEARPPRPLAPSAIAVDDAAALPPSPAMREAALRGTWIHQLLELLPAVAPADRKDAALRWLERSAGVAEPDRSAEIAGQVCAILADPRFADLFGPNSLGEAPLAATLPDGNVIAGTVDRLLIEPDRVAVIDFKTGRVPATDADIPNSHSKQMAAYSAALRVIFPERRVSASLLYTAGPKLIELTG